MQKAWIVPRNASWTSASARSARSLSRSLRPPSRMTASSAFWKRSESSAAALRVKVTAAISSIFAVPVVMRRTMRPTRAVVLPEPAPASTRMLLSRSSEMAARARWSGSDSS